MYAPMCSSTALILTDVQDYKDLRSSTSARHGPFHLNHTTDREQLSGSGLSFTVRQLWSQCVAVWLVLTNLKCNTCL